MRFRDLVKEIEHWIEEQKFGESVWVREAAECTILGFDIRTTKTRASSIVTRLDLMIKDISREHEFRVGHQLVSEGPKDRDDLATWTVFTVVGKARKKQEVAA